MSLTLKYHHKDIIIIIISILLLLNMFLELNFGEYHSNKIEK